jgi:hypothetical protein
MLRNIFGVRSLVQPCGVPYALNTLELVPFVGVELRLLAWYQVCCPLPLGLLGRMLQSYPPRDKGEDLLGLDR